MISVLPLPKAAEVFPICRLSLSDLLLMNLGLAPLMFGITRGDPSSLDSREAMRRGDCPRAPDFRCADPGVSGEEAGMESEDPVRGGRVFDVDEEAPAAAGDERRLRRPEAGLALEAGRFAVGGRARGPDFFEDLTESPLAMRLPTSGPAPGITSGSRLPALGGSSSSALGLDTAGDSSPGGGGTVSPSCTTAAASSAAVAPAAPPPPVVAGVSCEVTGASGVGGGLSSAICGAGGGVEAALGLSWAASGEASPEGAAAAALAGAELSRDAGSMPSAIIFCSTAPRGKCIASILLNLAIRGSSRLSVSPLVAAGAGLAKIFGGGFAAGGSADAGLLVCCSPPKRLFNLDLMPSLFPSRLPTWVRATSGSLSRGEGALPPKRPSSLFLKAALELADALTPARSSLPPPSAVRSCLSA
mmetsp:Transcript_19926/g.58184  ORF Transcript_19926/g.58184 Transcript_19926/m.58184 type:complete len:416 (+) Transcript_19926:228-1475(+)